MPDFPGKFQYFAPGGAIAQEGSCRVHFDAQSLTLTPESGTAALAFDLGDLDSITAADWQLQLMLYTGRTLMLRQLGRSYDTVAHNLTDAFRNRIVQCMLLEDMEEISRFTGSIEWNVKSGPAEMRLYKSNLAVLPTAAPAFQWRLADIDDVNFDSAAYEISLQSGPARLRVSRLAKRTEEFASKLREAINTLSTQTAKALHAMLPFLDPDQLQTCAGVLREGRSAPLTKLAAIHKQIPTALAANAIDKDLKPYYDQLIDLAAPGLAYVGFKLIRSDDSDDVFADDDTTDDTDDAPDADATEPETLYWFLVPLAARRGEATPANVVAWEANSRGGRATYFFRITDAARANELADPARAATLIDHSIQRLNFALAMLNFRRRPIYLSDEELARDPRFHRYAIAARRIPEVCEVRAAFLGRALHTSPEAWQSQADSILVKAGT